MSESEIERGENNGRKGEREKGITKFITSPLSETFAAKFDKKD